MSQIPHEDELQQVETTPETAEIATPEEEPVASEPVADEVSGEPCPRLIVKRAGQETEEVFTFAPPATIGRFDPSVGPIDIDLANLPEGSYVSRKHAKITLEDGVYTLTDLGSSNGTYVLRDDFERIDSAPIEDGTEIALGNARFVFRVM